MPTPFDRPEHSGSRRIVVVSSTTNNTSNSTSPFSPSLSSPMTSNTIMSSSSSTPSSSPPSSSSQSSSSSSSYNLLSCSPESFRSLLMEPFEDSPGINIGHITVIHNGYIILLSGSKGYKENSTTSYRPSEEIWIYDQIVEKWIKKICSTETDDKDDMPLKRSSACATIIDDYLYMFGGFSEEGNLNTLYRLSLGTLKWRRMKPGGREPLPCDKNVCWEYDDKFYLFGGYGPVPRIWSEDFKFQFVFDNSSHWHYLRGWNNQLACYDPSTNCWEWPEHSGQMPSARAACSASKIGDLVFLFGGRINKERMNDLYVLNMNSMKWTQIQPNNPDHPVRGRSWHTLTPMSEHSLVLYGGFSHDDQPLKDCWIFDIRTYVWRQIFLPFAKPRFWHSATLSPFGEILVLGGAVERLNGVTFQRSPEYNHIFAQDMFAIQFQPQSLFRLCLGVIAENITLTERLFSMIPKQLMEIVLKRCITSDNLIKFNIIQNNLKHIVGNNNDGTTNTTPVDISKTQPFHQDQDD